MEGDDDNIDIHELYEEIKELRTQLRLTKTDRDIISRYTSQIKREMDILQERYAETLNERDFYLASLNDLKSLFAKEIKQFTQDKTTFTEEIAKLSTIKKELQNDLEECRNDLRNVNFEYDVIQVDFYKEKEQCKELNNQLREIRKKYRHLQNEINESDKATTKRLSRLIERLDNIEFEKKSLQEQIQYYEQEIEHANLLCFVCRTGVKRVSCPNCDKKICRKCYESIDICPFCRHNFPSLPECE